ncbi:MAG: NAD(P)/FAD-dependent oxidoreductase [Parvibaculaceae bacterium]
MDKPKAKAVDVAIVGGGIIGCAIAWYLVKRGLTVGVYEKGRIAGEQSGKNAGFVRKQGRDHREMALIIRSLDLWRTIDADIEGETGLVESGNFVVAGSPEKLEAMRGWLAIAREFGVETHLLTGSAMQDVQPRLRSDPRLLGALYTPSDCRAEPSLAAPAIAAALKRKGADMRENCHVQALITEGGRAAGIVTEEGEIRARTVVVAAGLWSGIFLARYGVFVPQSDLTISVGRTAPFDHGLRIPSWIPDVLLRPRFDGGLTIALGMVNGADYEATWRSLAIAGRFLPTWWENRRTVAIRLGKRLAEAARWKAAYLGTDRSRYDEIRVPNVPPNQAWLDQCAAAARRDFQFTQPLDFVEKWACRVDVTPDGIPVIDEAPHIAGLVIATGMSGHGFGISLGVGDAVAEFIATGRTTIPLREFRLARFAERYFGTHQNVV